MDDRGGTTPGRTRAFAGPALVLAFVVLLAAGTALAWPSDGDGVRERLAAGPAAAPTAPVAPEPPVIATTEPPAPAAPPTVSPTPVPTSPPARSPAADAPLPSVAATSAPPAPVTEDRGVVEARLSVPSSTLQVPISVVLTNNRRSEVQLLGSANTCGTVTTQTAHPAPSSPLADGQLDAFRARALRQASAEVDVPVRVLGGCPAGNVVLQPGQTLVRTFGWTATTADGAAYDGPVTLGVEVIWDVPFLHAAKDSIHVRLVGGDPERLSTSEAVDLALADPDFASAVRAAPQPSSGGLITPTPDSPVHGFFVAAPQPPGGTVFVDVDARTGDVSAVRRQAPIRID